jgi:endoglucanase
LAASSKQDELVVFIGGQDDYWGGDQNIPSDRPSFVVSRQKPGTDVFGSCASALAAASMLYNGTSLPISSSDSGAAASLQNSSYSSLLLDRAQTLFNLAQTATPQQVYQKATTGVDWAYGSSDYQDELVFSATMLALATSNKSYADYAIQAYSDGGYPVASGAVNWDSRAPALPVLISQLALAQPSMGISFSKYQADAEIWFDNIIAKRMSQTFTTKGGLFWFQGDSDPASLNPALNAAALMLMFRGMASSMDKSNRYQTFAQSQIDYVLGKNPMSAVYPVGVHPNSPKNPQSALASGGTDGDDIDTSPPVEMYVLYGGVVGGPNKNDQYYDRRSDYVQTEVALDYQTPLIAIVAYQLVNNASDPYYVKVNKPLSTPSGSDSSNGGLSTGAKIGIAVGVALGVLLILGLLACWQRGRIRAMASRRKLGKGEPGDPIRLNSRTSWR